jgi:tetratricopeptide (TPR) repeat protein
VYDYSQPLVVSQAPLSSTQSQSIVTESLVDPPDASEPGLTAFDAARDSFLRGDYSASLSQVDEALVELPDDAVLHEFRGLVLFSLGRFDEAAAALYAVLAVGPGWDWATLSSLYEDVPTYTNQLRVLERHVHANPDSSQGHFVLGYHYLTCGHEDAAAKQFKEVLRITPGQKVATDLLTMLVGPEAVQDLEGAAQPVMPPPAGIDAPAVKPEQVQGAWKATGPDDSTFELTLEKDGSFTWKFERDGRSEQVQGVWALDGRTLAMEPDTGGTMLAEISSLTDEGFTFRMAGAEASDQGLRFAPRE